MEIVIGENYRYIGQQEISADVEVVMVFRAGEIIEAERGMTIELMVGDEIEVRPLNCNFTTVLVEATDLSH